MKKILSWGLMLAAAFTLTNCAKEITNPDQQPETVGYPFEISASVVDTKTVNDGMSTKWVAGDKINLFHAVCDGTDYKNDGAFTISNVDASKFGGSLCETLDVEEEYDWYAFYPYTSALATPKNTTVEINIGTDLVQDGYGSMAHLAGEALPLYGKAIAVPGADMPSIKMNQLASVIAVNVTNNTAAPIEVNEVEFFADGNYLTGTYYVDFSGASVEYKPAQAQVTATVTVNNATSLAVGATATVYIPIIPFSAWGGDSLRLTVNGEVTKELYIENDVHFTAGKIKNLNFSYVVEEEPEPEVPAFEPGEYWIVANGKYAMPITSGTYGYLKVDEVGYTDNVFTISAVEGGYTIQQPDGKYLYMTGSYDSFNVSATAPSDNGHVWTIELNEDGSYKILNVLKQKYIQLDSTYGTYGSYNTVKGTMPNLVPADDAVVRPVFTVASNAKTVACDVTEASFDITSNQSWTVVPGEGVSVDVTSGNGNGVVTLTFAANETETAVVYRATVQSEGFADVVLTVNQSGVPSGDEPVGGGRADFETIKSTNTNYVASTTTAGWKGTNCAVLKGGTSDANPVFKCLLDENGGYAVALCMNGKTSAKGTIESPTLTDGCGTLTFNYTYVFSESKAAKFKVEIIQNGTTVKEFTVTGPNATKFAVNEGTLDVNVAGDFKVKFSNLSPSNSTSNKDRTAVWNVAWTGYTE